MSDWSAQHSGVASTLAGLDMSMPGDTGFNTGQSFWGGNLTASVINGTVPAWRLQDMATRIMSAYYYVDRDTHQIPVNFQSWTRSLFGYEHAFANSNFGQVNFEVNVRANHGQIIRDHAAKSTVLLKNTHSVLPLTGKEKLTAVFGDDAGDNPLGPNGCPDRGCNSGTLAMGWGSGTTNFPYLISPLTAIQNELLRYDSQIQFVINGSDVASVTALAPMASVALVFVSADSGEDYITVDGAEGDRNDLTLAKNGDALIANVTSLCNNTIVVIHSVGPVDMSAWANNPNVTAILWAGLPGEQSGMALADILYGRVNPGGKLPFTVASKRQDYGTDILYGTTDYCIPQVNFTEGILIDYRWLDSKNITPTYEFGFGLSYTTFEYSNLTIKRAPHTPLYTQNSGMTAPAPSSANFSHNPMDYQFPPGINPVLTYIYPYLSSNSSGPPLADNSPTLPTNSTSGLPQPKPRAGGAPGGNPRLYDTLYTVSATVRNTGKVPGDEVVQLYLSLGGPTDAPRVLRGFERVHNLAPGANVTVKMVLNRKDVMNWNTDLQDWEITAFAKTVYVGGSSRSLPLSAALPVYQ
jgi:beta-glucosidase